MNAHALVSGDPADSSTPVATGVSTGLFRAWSGMTAYTILVILFGAVVRITGSGAGCGQHWPTCQGAIAPLPHSVEMAIEFSHRLTSGLSMLVLFGLTIWTFRRVPRGHLARRGAVYSCVFMIAEALIGARLVLLGLVGQNDSAPRAVIMALHLVNTSALVAALLVTVWASRDVAVRRLGLSWGAGQWPFACGALLMLVVSGAGAVTALGDTLYPVLGGQTGTAVVRAAVDHGSHFLERLRGAHPLLALLGGVFWGSVAWRLPDASPVRSVLIWLLALQLGAGVMNVALSAPGWMQVVHLAMANLLWIAWLWAWFHKAEGRWSLAPSR